MAGVGTQKSLGEIRRGAEEKWEADDVEGDRHGIAGCECCSQRAESPEPSWPFAQGFSPNDLLIYTQKVYCKHVDLWLGRLSTMRYVREARRQGCS